MVPGPGRVRGMLGAGVVLVVATGCVDPIVNRPTADAERWSGRAEAVAGDETACGVVALDLFRDGLAIGGTAEEPETRAEGAIAAMRRWWVEGSVNPNGTFLFSLRRQGPVLEEGPRAASVWRGRFVGLAGEVVALEQPPSCGRRVKLVRVTEAGPAP